MIRVTLYTRRGCHLCEDAKAGMLGSGARFELVEVDIDADDELRARYTNDVPVVAVDGVELFYHHVDPSAFLQALRQERGRRERESSG
jgi:glutaredoxin